MLYTRNKDKLYLVLMEGLRKAIPGDFWKKFFLKEGKKNPHPFGEDFLVNSLFRSSEYNTNTI